MNEQVKLLEAQMLVLQNQVTRMDQVLGVLFNRLLVEKQFLDQLQIKVPEAPKVEDPKVAETTNKQEPTLLQA